VNKLQIADIIIKKRGDKGITQLELAEHMGVSKAAVSKWEKKQSYPDITLLPRLAAFFNVNDVFALLGESISARPLNEGSLIAQAFVLAGNKVKAKEVYQCDIHNFLLHLAELLVEYVYLLDDDFDAAQTAYNRVMGLVRLFNIGKLDPDIMAKAYLIGADMYCKHGDLENALELLEKYLDFCTTKFFPFTIKGDDFFTDVSKWLNRHEADASVINEQAVKAGMLLDLYGFSSFEVLNDNPRYKRIVKKFIEFVENEP